MATVTWIGGQSLHTDPNDATDPANWVSGFLPQAGDTIIIPATKTFDYVDTNTTLSDVTIQVAGTADVINFGSVVMNGGGLTSGDGAGFGDFVWNITDSTLDATNITLGDFAMLNLTGSSASSMQITSNASDSVIKQTGSGDQLQINAAGTVSTDNNLFLLATGGSASINVAQEGTAAGFYQVKSALVVSSESLSITGDSNTGTRFSNQGFVLVTGLSADAAATLDARMNSIAGFTDLLGASHTALLDDGTNIPGAQLISFGDASGVLKIEASKTLSSAFNVVTGGTTVVTTVLQNFFGRVSGFKPGDTIDLAGVNPSGLSWSFGNDPNYGNDVLTINRGAAEVARIRFSGEQWVDGTGTFGAANTTNFTFSDDGSGGTAITLANTQTVDGSIVVTGTVAQWAGVTNGATTDWSNTAMWTGGTGTGGLPGQFQTTQISLSQAEVQAAVAAGTSTNYVLTVTSAETAGAVIMDDPLATLAVSAPLSLSGITGQSGGSGFTNAAGAVDIRNGGTVATLRFLTQGHLTMEAGGVLVIGGNVPFTFGSGLAGLDVEKQADVTGGTIASFGNITVGANSNANMTASAGALLSATYTQVGGNSALTGADNPLASLQISGATTKWFDTNVDASTPLDGAMIVGGGAPSSNPLDQIINNGGGDGLVSITNGAVAVEASFAIIAATRTSQGEVDVSNGGTWLVGTGDIATPGSIVFGNTIVGTSTLFGSNLPQLVVGSGGAGTLNVNSGTVILGGATAFDRDRMFIGTGNAGNNGATGVVNVQGAGALLNANGPVTVSLRSSGTLNVTNGGTVMVAGDPTTANIEEGLLVGNENGTVGPNAGTVNVNTGGLLTDNGDLVLGRNSQGFMNVGSSGSVNVNGAMIMGGLIALNNGTTALAAPTLFKSSSSGTLHVSGNGIITVAGNALDMFQGGTTTPTPSMITLDGSGELLLGNPVGITPAAGELTVAAGATLQGAGAVIVSSTDSTLRNFGTVLAGGLTSGGALAQNNTTLDLNAVLAGTGVYAVAPGGALRLENGVVNTSNFDFGTANFGANPAHSEIIVVAHPVAFQGTVSDFYGAKNKIDFLNDPLSSQPTYNAASGLVTVNGTLSFHVTGVHTGFSALSDGAGGTVVTANDATPCFAAGTRILTARGEVPVEDLRVGDAVPTRSGALRGVRWVGCTRVMVDDATAPVAVAEDAFAPGVPHAPLVLSPDHAVLAGGALVPVRYLANGGSIARAERRGIVEYFHVELDRHDVLFAAGLAAESYLDTGNRARFDSRADEPAAPGRFAQTMEAADDGRYR